MQRVTRRLPNDVFSGLNMRGSLSFNNSDLRIIPRHAFRGMQGRINSVYLTNCNLTVFPGEALSVFTRLTLLKLASNQITDIPDGSFRQFPLRELHLGNNPLRNVNREGLLSGLESSLVSLSLKNLDITTFPIALLWNLTRLGYVQLNRNRIESLPDDMLQDFRTASQLSLILSDNRIHNVSEHFLRGTNISLWRINLSGNQLTNLDFLDLCLPQFHYDRLQVRPRPSVTLKDNPLQCDCELLTLLTKRGVHFKGHCAEPPVLRGMSLRVIKQNRFNVTRNNEQFSCPHMEKINCTQPLLQAPIRTGSNTVVVE